MNFQKEALQAVSEFLSQAEAGLGGILEILDQNPALRDSVFGGAKCDLEIGLSGARQWLDELEEAQKVVKVTVINEEQREVA